jgi:hypothetical protein
MKFRYPALISILLFLAAGCAHQPEKKHFSIWDFDHMYEVKKKLKRGNSTYRAAYNELKVSAAKAMERGPYSVTYKSVIPPGGTKNDYMSMGPYWWPDPSKPDGLPYIRRDGEVNPESGMDRDQLRSLIEDVRTLALTWYFSGDREYAEKAGNLLRTWFLDPETRMNPHLEYGQAIPGRTHGRGIGIIDTRSFSTLVDAILLLESTPAMKNSEEKELKAWFSAFFEWLTTSQHGKDEDVYPNNHSVAYDAQVTAIARYLGNDEFVTQKTSAAPSVRIDKMIRADGRQPEELIRTKAFGYSVSNLGNFFDLGETGLKVGVDIFSYTNSEGGSLKQALEFLNDFIGRPDEWPWEQIDGWEQAENNLGLLVRRAARYYQNAEYQIMWEEAFYPKMKTHWSILVIPGLS